MKTKLLTISALMVLGSSGCVAGPGGAYNAANRTIVGVAAGALLGGVAGHAMGDPFSGAAVGAVVGGGVGAAVNPKAFDRDTRGYCYVVDAQGQPVTYPADSVECKAAMNSPAPVQ